MSDVKPGSRNASMRARKEYMTFLEMTMREEFEVAVDEVHLADPEWRLVEGLRPLGFVLKVPVEKIEDEAAVRKQLCNMARTLKNTRLGARRVALHWIILPAAEHDFETEMHKVRAKAYITVLDDSDVVDLQTDADVLHSGSAQQES